MTSPDGPETNTFEQDEKHQNKRETPPQQRPISDESEVSDVAAEGAEVVGNQNQNLTSGLPFSKARCIALVATLAGASFLNVSHPILLLESLHGI